MKKINTGVTLIELIFVIVIIAILSSIAISSYRNYLLVNRRSDAMSTLVGLSSIQESYRFNNPQYGLLSQLQSAFSGVYSLSPQGYYSLTISSVTSTGYTLTAAASGDQMSDTPCANIVLSVSNGVESRTPKVCWQGY